MSTTIEALTEIVQAVDVLARIYEQIPADMRGQPSMQAGTIMGIKVRVKDLMRASMVSRRVQRAIELEKEAMLNAQSQNWDDTAIIKALGGTA